MGLEFRWTFDDFDPPKVLRFSSRNCQAVQQSLLELLRAVPGFAQVQMLGSFCYERHRKTWQSHASHFKFRKDYRNILVSKAEREREMPGDARRKPRGFLCLCCSHGDLGRGQLSKVWLRSMGCRFHCSIAWRSDAEWFFNVLHVFGKLFHFPA